MKKTLIIAAALLLASCGQKAPKLETQKDTISWVTGQSMAESLMQTGFDLDKELVLKAVEATLNNRQQPLDQQTYQQVLSYLTGVAIMNQREQAMAQQAQVSEKQKAYFEQLLKEKPDLKKTPGGFYYEVLQAGHGRTINTGEVAKFHYRAYTAIDGRLFDQTYGNRDAIVHVVGDPMLPAMAEALTLMNAGSIFRVYLPHEAVANVMGGLPDAQPIIYELELLEINPKNTVQ